MRAYHFLREDWRSGKGNEPPWTVGETRTYPGHPEMCIAGYHSSPSWLDALQYAPGPVATVVEVSEPTDTDALATPGHKAVSQTRTLIAGADASRALRIFACDCADRAISFLRARGIEPGPRSLSAIAVARRFAEGHATTDELDAAQAAAWAAARDASQDAAWAAARDASWGAAQAAARDAAQDAAWAAAQTASQDAVWDAAQGASWAAAGAAAWAAARDAEIEWQRHHLAEMLDALVCPNDTQEG
jgi:hypothetical protein